MNDRKILKGFVNSWVASRLTNCGVRMVYRTTKLCCEKRINSKSMEKEEELYLGKKVSELNIHEQRFRKFVQLMRMHKTLEKAEVTHKKMPKNGRTR
jgi:hypothetical protein